MKNHSCGVRETLSCPRSGRQSFRYTPLKFLMFVALVLVCNLVLPGMTKAQAPTASTTITTPIATSVAYDRSLKVTKTNTDLVLDGKKPAVAQFTLEFPGNSSGTLRMEAGASYLKNDSNPSAHISYVMKIKPTAGFTFDMNVMSNSVISGMTGDVLSPAFYNTMNMLGHVGASESPQLKFTLTLNEDEVTKAPPGTYQKTFTFQIKAL